MTGEVWIVGTGAPDWELEAVCSTHARAVELAKERGGYIWPMTIDEPAPPGRSVHPRLEDFRGE